MYNIMDLSRIADMIQQDVQQFFLGIRSPSQSEDDTL